MKLANLCPACLTELPSDYPYDHVAIDQALDTQPHLFASMTAEERVETVLTGLQRSMTIARIAARLHTSSGRLRALLPADHPESTVNHRTATAADRDTITATVTHMWQQGMPDTTIAPRTGHSVYKIADIRRKLGLPTLPATHRRALSGGAR